MLEPLPMPQFDAGTLEYDIERYPFDKWCTKKVREAGYEVEDLSALHEVIALEDLPSLTKFLISEAGKPDFQEMAHAFVAEYMQPLVGCDLAVQRFPNVRAVLPGRPDMRLPFHQGIWVGHGWGIGTMWIPVTRAFDSNSMYITDLDTSKKLTRRATVERWSRDKMEVEFTKHASPCNFQPGQACTFTEGNIHGNMPNQTGVTRMSIDFRFLRRGGQFFWKSPGGYFIVPGTYEGAPPDKSQSTEQPAAKREQAAEERSFISYCENNTEMTRGIPVPLQRLAIRDYCNERSIKFRYEHVELIGMKHAPILSGIIHHDEPDEVVLYSVYALPENASDRKAILDAALDKGIVLHFVNELEVMRDAADRERIERIITFTDDFSSPIEQLLGELNMR